MNILRVVVDLFTVCSRTNNIEIKEKYEQNNMMSPILPVIETLDFLEGEELQYDLLSPLSDHEFFLPPIMEEVVVE